MHLPDDDRTHGPPSDLLGGWNLDAGGDAEDSLLAPPRPTGPSPFGKVRSFRLPPLERPESFPTDTPFLDFQLDAPPEGPASLPEPPPTHDHAGPKPVPDLPRSGDSVGGFFLVSELGRGAFARVFLAEQAALGGRPVALKVSRAEGEEPQLLARLQHTHIVPIFSAHDDPATGLRLLCMPYLGGANLAQVLDAVGGRASAAGKRSLVEALDEVNQRHGASAAGAASRLPSGRRPPTLAVPAAEAPLSGPPSSAPGWGLAASLRRGSFGRLQSLWDRMSWRGSRRSSGGRTSLDDRDFDQPARQFLREANSTQGAVWIVARLAEGLEHAHSRGLLHRDLKPSNVLIAADGTPMLLDFNLSSLSGLPDPGEGERALLGGTLPYMAPEHLDAFHPHGLTPPEAVDERSDLYALGLILYEILAGEPPFAEPPGGMPLLESIRFLIDQRQTVPSLRKVNPEVTPGLDAIVRKCLDPDPARRYQRARDLADDLNRFLADQPLRHVREASLRERAQKWARRNPRLCGASSMAGFAAMAVIAMAGVLGTLMGVTATMSARLKLQVFRAEVAECRFLLNPAGAPDEHLTRGVAMAARVTDHLGLRADGTPGRDSWAARLTPAEVREVRSDAAEVLLREVRSRVALAERRGSEDFRRRTLQWAVARLDRAEKIDPDAPGALYATRAAYHRALGQAGEAARDRAAEAARPPATARDFALRGGNRLAANDLAGAVADLSAAVALDPKSFWSWFALGHAHAEQGLHLDAAGDFAACIALEPRFSWPYLDRGLALSRAGRLTSAHEYLARAVEVSPRFAEAWLNLALNELELNNLEAAEKALGKALDLGLDGSGVRTAWAEVKGRLGSRAEAERLFAQLLKSRPRDPALLTARGIFRVRSDPAGARTDLEQAIAIDPRSARAHQGLAMLLRNVDPRAALAETDAALHIEPNLLDALQLRALLRARLGDPAAVDDAERLCLTPTPHRLYNAACAFALLTERAGQPALATRALDKLERALDAGFNPAEAAADPDLKSLHNLPAYQKLLQSRGRGAAPAKAHAG